MRRALVTTGLALLISLTLTGQSSAQSTGGWSIQLEANGGFFTSTRDIGKILGEEVQAQIRTELQAAPMYSMGLFLRGPSPRYSLRASFGFMSTDATGQALGCDSGTISGPGCVTYDIPTTSMHGFFDVILHNDDGSPGPLKYFFAGLGMRSYAFDEVGCRGLQDPNQFSVCTPMEEFLADQVGLFFRLGIGARGSAGPVGWTIEVSDMVGRFEGSGLRGEGGTQNDFAISAGLAFPGR